MRTWRCAVALVALGAWGASRHDVVGRQEVRVQYDASARSVRVTDANGQVIPSVQAYWFAWAAFYPDTLVHHGSR